MPKKIEEKIHVLCPSRAYLAPAKVMGPIVHPLAISKTAAVQILMSGAKLYEYIPKTKKTLELTLGNINDPNRYDEVAPKAVDTTPVVKPTMKVGVPKVETTPAVTEEPIETVAQVEVAPEVVETPVTEEAPVEEVATTEEPLIVFEYNADGTVDETKIEWSKYSKNQRKEIRAQITAHNESLTTAE